MYFRFWNYINGSKIVKYILLKSRVLKDIKKRMYYFDILKKNEKIKIVLKDVKYYSYIWNYLWN